MIKKNPRKRREWQEEILSGIGIGIGVGVELQVQNFRVVLVVKKTQFVIDPRQKDSRTHPSRVYRKGNEWRT